MRADCLAPAMHWSGVPQKIPGECMGCARQGALHCAPELTPNLERTGGWAFISGVVEVLPGVVYIGDRPRFIVEFCQNLM